jgi:hypothetical protein
MFHDHSYLLQEFRAEYSGDSTRPQVGILIVMNKDLSDATLIKKGEDKKLGVNELIWQFRLQHEVLFHQ